MVRGSYHNESFKKKQQNRITQQNFRNCVRKEQICVSVWATEFAWAPNKMHETCHACINKTKTKFLSGIK